MSGDLEWATGQPMTPAKVKGDFSPMAYLALPIAGKVAETTC